jgi:thiamine kinase-like enzyme
LVFSHGDFSLVNIINTKNGIKVIDWESAGRRSVLFDLHNYFLTEVYYKRATLSIASEIDQAIAMLQARLAPSAPELAKTLPSRVQTYRELYYLERVCTLLDRELNDQRLDVILRSIDVFERYEQAATQRRKNT